MDDLVGHRLDGYQIVAPIGKGGMATVYKGLEVATGRTVAIKVLAQNADANTQIEQRFVNEARLVAKLDHPHILPVLSFGHQESLLYIAMPYLPTGTLADRIPPDGMPLNDAVYIFQQISGALHYAHIRDVVHRDIKPANILFDDHDHALLSDFGVAQDLRQTLSERLTAAGNVVGTPRYMSPEQGLGRQLDARSDIYAMGVLLFEMLTGEVPFSGDSPMAVMLMHINNMPPQPRASRPDLHPSIEAVVLRALAKQPAKRYQTAQAMSDALEYAAAEARHTTHQNVAVGETREARPDVVQAFTGQGDSAPTVPAPVSRQLAETRPAGKSPGQDAPPPPGALQAMWLRVKDRLQQLFSAAVGR